MAFNKKKNFINAQSTVVASAYDCSGAGGRKLVRLDNGWLVAVVLGNSYLYWYVSKNNGKSWEQWAYHSLGSAACSMAMTVHKNRVHTFAFALAATSAYCCTFTTALPLGSNVGSLWVTVDTGQSSFGTGCSITADKFGVLHAAWCSKNSSYPNSFNIRYSKSTDGGVTWAGVTQITNVNASGANFLRPCIVTQKTGYPVIINDWISGSDYGLECYRYNGTSWVNVTIKASSTYAQCEPCAVVDNKGIIHVVWYGLDSTDTAHYNVRYSKSLDNGVTWSTAIKLTSGNTYDKYLPSISCDKNGQLCVIFSGEWSGSTTYRQLHKAIFNGTWTTVEGLTSAGAHQYYSQALECCDNINTPPFIWQDNAASAIKFMANSRIDAKRRLPIIWEADSNTTDKSQQVSLRPRRTIPVQYP